MKPWFRKPGEPERAYACFLSYLHQAAPRSLSRVTCEGYAISKSEASGLAGLWSWFERATAFDNGVAAVREQERLEVARYSAQDRQVAQERLLATSLRLAERELHKALAASERSEAAGIVRIEVILQLVPKLLQSMRLLAGDTTENVGNTKDPYQGCTLEQLRAIERILSDDPAK